MRSFIICKRDHKLEIPEQFREYNNRTPEGVVEYFIEEFTKPGDTILDIFAGMGTTLIIAEQLKRIPYGIEFLEDKYNYIISKIHHKENIIHGDARKLSEYKFPPIDFVFTSPIFMSKEEIRDPFDGYKTEGNYNKYLNDTSLIFTDLKKFLKPDAYVVVMVANLKGGEITTLAWDVGKKLSKIFQFEGEIIIGWDSPRDSESFGYDHSYCLVFTNKH
ncbi:MAG: DNA methyltransferase [Candidatus Thorarchaeota archaeon]